MNEEENITVQTPDLPITEIAESRLARRHQLTNVKRFRMAAAILLCVSFLFLVVRPVYQGVHIKIVTTGIKIKDLRKQQDYTALRKLSDPNTVLLDTSNRDGAIAKLAIPSLELYLPIFEGAGNKNKNRSAATPLSYQVLGADDYRLTANKYRFKRELLFGSLAEIEKGTLIFISDGENLYEYEAQTFTKEATTSDAFFLTEPSEPCLTLYTEGSKGDVVRARLNQVVSYASAEPYFKELLNK